MQFVVDGSNYGSPVSLMGESASITDSALTAVSTASPRSTAAIPTSTPGQRRRQHRHDCNPDGHSCDDGDFGEFLAESLNLWASGDLHGGCVERFEYSRNANGLGAVRDRRRQPGIRHAERVPRPTCVQSVRDYEHLFADSERIAAHGGGELHEHGWGFHDKQWDAEPWADGKSRSEYVVHRSQRQQDWRDHAGFPKRDHRVPTKTSGSAPEGITWGPDGNVWFAENTPNNIGVIVPLTAAITEYPISNYNAANNTYAEGAYAITTGPDGNVWFTESQSSQNTSYVGNITTSGTILFPTPTSGAAPHGITAGPDGNLWFTENGNNSVARVTTSGAVTEFPTPTPTQPAVRKASR